ncbi:type I restriction enzyme HsdR N-terminal domain-containing protein [Blattabacterium sp. DPU]|uniref:type I restriction enzyme HsdR N-terminal domain-containing protein n=1 Tax=Blattabacterium sp. DPU TaxID=2715232 RepID=UPI00140A5CE4|nr:type I restriction enzyme HsdR N-terminal domain-containing protein [Blattabacterium sp. DPU]QIK16464.1 type I restriction enzyme HsdR N-terminal domain-containing protein [Blattabacterium sp. DPU]
MHYLNFFIRRHLHLKMIKNRIHIFCVIRKKFYLFTQEEVIRQYIIFLLKKIKNYQNSNIWVEHPLKVNKLNKRLDILVQFHKKPHILIECKTPKIPITQKTFDQISIYNKIIKAPFLMVSNGVNNFIFKIDKYKRKFLFLKYIP